MILDIYLSYLRPVVIINMEEKMSLPKLLKRFYDLYKQYILFWRCINKLNKK